MKTKLILCLAILCASACQPNGRVGVDIKEQVELNFASMRAAHIELLDRTAPLPSIYDEKTYGWSINEMSFPKEASFTNITIYTPSAKAAADRKSLWEERGRMPKK